MCAAQEIEKTQVFQKHGPAGFQETGVGRIERNSLIVAATSERLPVKRLKRKSRLSTNWSPLGKHKTSRGLRVRIGWDSSLDCQKQPRAQRGLQKVF